MDILNPDTLVHAVTLGCMALMGFLAKRVLVDELSATRKALATHVDECNRVPKAVLLEKLTHVEEKIGDVKRELEKHVDRQSARYDALSDTLQQVSGRLGSP